MNMTANLLDQYDGMLAKVADREEILRCADQIPPLPEAVLRVLELLDDPNADAGELAAAVGRDTRLTTALLKLANSPVYPQAQGVLSVQDAVTSVGAIQLRALALATSLMGQAKHETMDKLVWENSLATAMIARRLAEEVGHPQPEQVFLMGLLHCLGQFIFLAHPKTRLAYAGVLRRIQKHNVDYVTAELEEIGFSHNLIGALAANRWNFPDEICQAILHFPDPLEPTVSAAGQKRVLVKLADLLAHAAFIGRPPGYPIAIEMIEQLAGCLGIKLTAQRGVVELILLARNQLKKDAELWAALAP